MGRNDKRIRELTPVTEVNGTDYLVIDQSDGPARAATVNQLLAAAGVIDDFACYIGATAPTSTYAGQFWLEP